MGKYKAEVAARFVEKRVKGVTITPYCGKIQDKDEDYYMQFGMVVCGLDSIEARRWINATLVGMVDMENPDSLKPLIDGGTEGKSFSISPQQRKNPTNDSARLQGPGTGDLTDYDVLYRVSARHARAASRSPSLHPCHHSETATALHRVGAYHSLGRGAQG